MQYTWSWILLAACVCGQGAATPFSSADPDPVLTSNGVRACNPSDTIGLLMVIEESEKTKRRKLAGLQQDLKHDKDADGSMAQQGEGSESSFSAAASAQAVSALQQQNERNKAAQLCAPWLQWVCRKARESLSSESGKDFGPTQETHKCALCAGGNTSTDRKVAGNAQPLSDRSEPARKCPGCNRGYILRVRYSSGQRSLYERCSTFRAHAKRQYCNWWKPDIAVGLM